MPHTSTARLFVAIDPPAEVGQELAGWARAVAAASGSRTQRDARRPLRLLAAETLHLTICFLGSRPIEEVEALAAALGSCAAHVGELRVGAPLWLPPRRPRALVVEIQDGGGGELETLHETLTRAICAVSSWESPRRRLRAHITLARMGADAAAGRRRPGGESILPVTPQLRFTPRAIVLYRSRLSPVGASYEALATCDLIGGER